MIYCCILMWCACVSYVCVRRSRSYSVPRSRANKTAIGRSKPVAPSSSGGSKSRARPRQAPVSPPSPSPPPANRRLAKGNKPSDPRRAPVASSRVRAAQHEVIELSPSPRSAPPVDVSARARDKAALAANPRGITKNKKERKDKEKVCPQVYSLLHVTTTTITSIYLCRYC